MNTTRLTHITTIAAVAVAAVLAAGFVTRAPSPTTDVPVVQLDTVVITAHRASAEPMAVVELPTVVVIGKRSNASTLVAEKDLRSTAAKDAV